MIFWSKDRLNRLPCFGGERRAACDEQHISHTCLIFALRRIFPQVTYCQKRSMTVSKETCVLVLYIYVWSWEWMRKITAKAPCGEISRIQIFSKEIYDCVKWGLCICAIYIYVILRMDGENCQKAPLTEIFRWWKSMTRKDLCVTGGLCVGAVWLFSLTSYLPEIHPIEKFEFLGTTSNQSKISIWICTARYRKFRISRFGGFRGCRILSGNCHTMIFMDFMLYLKDRDRDTGAKTHRMPYPCRSFSAKEP